MQRLLKLPLHFIAIFTWNKSFRHNLFIGNWLLNRLGLHVFRVVLAHALFRLRLLILSPLACRKDRQQFLRHGILVKPGFLSGPAFARLLNEVCHYEGPIQDIREGSTDTQRVLLTRAVRHNLPACEELTSNAELSALMRYTSSLNRPPVYFIENIRQHARSTDQRDPQKDLHMDTFHPCVKGWLFLDEVTLENGPFMYVPGSHRLSWRRLRWEYRQSLLASRPKDYPPERYWDGSFRVTASDLHDMGFTPPQAMVVPANTLVIANVHGFHCRGNATQAGQRLSIWMQSRDNPFLPLFTPFPKLAGRVVEKVWHYFLERENRRHSDSRPGYVGRFQRDPKE